MQYLDFEKPIEELTRQIEELKAVGKKNNVDIAAPLQELEAKLFELRKEIYAHLTSWQRVQLSRHPDRPYTLYYVEKLCAPYIELHGDRLIGDDKAMVGGIGQIDGETIVWVGHQKGINTMDRKYRNFGMANPEGYRKALRLYRLAERFGFPIINFIDTPGAFPGLEAEERGQAEAIARNLYEMMLLRVPIICIIIGEGASGGALGIGIGDRVLMLENTWYSVISPESCSSILWHSWEKKEEAANQLKLTAHDMLQFGLIDGLIAEPTGGAHQDPEATVARVREEIKKHLAELKLQTAEHRIHERIRKFSSMGHVEVGAFD